MAATTTLLGLVTPTQGTLSGTWGDTVNYGITDYLDIAIAGTLSFAGDGAITLANTLGSASGNGITSTTAQYMVIRITGTQSVVKVITGPSYSKLYMVDHAGATSAVTFKAAGQTGVTVAVGEKCFVYYNGTDYVKVASSVADGVTTIDFGSTGLTPNTATSGAVTVAGTLAVASGGTGITSFGAGIATFLGTPSSANLAAALTDETGSGSAVFATSPALVTPNLGTPSAAVLTSATGLPLTTGVTGILPIANGGTATATPALVQGSGVTITGTWPNQTIAATGSGGTVTSVAATVPSLLSVSGSPITTSGTLAFTYSGTALPVANGGTGAPTLTANNVILGNGTSAPLFVAPGSTGNVLTSDGSTWTSAAVASGLSGITQSVSPFETALGFEAGNVTTGVNNTWVGYRAGLLTTTGTNNTAVGFQALDANTTGSNNVAMGSSALGANTTGANNTAVGYQVLDANTTGQSNVALGSDALGANTTASFNTAIGFNALLVNTTGANNTAVGYQTLDANTTGASNTAVGSAALGANTLGTNNTAIGQSALAVNTTGTDNIAVGYQALDANTTGSSNVAMGSNALGAATTANSNTAIGWNSAKAITTGASNTAIGYESLQICTTGAENTAVGAASLDQLTTGSNNTAVGFRAGDNVTTGQNNIVIGHSAGNITTGSNNVLIGYQASASSATVSNEITFGDGNITSLRVPGLSISWAATDVPFRNIPQNSQSAAYTLVASDAGKHIFHPVGDNNARTFTIPANSSVAYPIGTAITFINMAVANVTIAITTDTLTLSPAGTTGSRTLATNGSATCIKITSTEWLISGSGLT